MARDRRCPVESPARIAVPMWMPSATATLRIGDEPPAARFGGGGGGEGTSRRTVGSIRADRRSCASLAYGRASYPVPGITIAGRCRIAGRVWRLRPAASKGRGTRRVVSDRPDSRLAIARSPRRGRASDARRRCIRMPGTRALRRVPGIGLRGAAGVHEEIGQSCERRDVAPGRGRIARVRCRYE